MGVCALNRQIDRAIDRKKRKGKRKKGRPQQPPKNLGAKPEAKPASPRPVTQLELDREAAVWIPREWAARLPAWRRLPLERRKQLGVPLKEQGPVRLLMMPNGRARLAPRPKPK